MAFEVCRRLNLDEATSKIPVGFKVGGVDCITKAFQQDFEYAA